MPFTRYESFLRVVFYATLCRWAVDNSMIYELIFSVKKNAWVIAVSRVNFTVMYLLVIVTTVRAQI